MIRVILRPRNDALGVGLTVTQAFLAASIITSVDENPIGLIECAPRIFCHKSSTVFTCEIKERLAH